MFEEIKSLTENFFRIHRMRKVGFLLGIIFGAIILIFGFFKTMFAVFCGLIGLYIGSRFDEGDDLINRTLKAIENILPDRFQRF